MRRRLLLELLKTLSAGTKEVPGGGGQTGEAGVKRGRPGGGGEEWGLTMPKDALSPFE